MKQLNLLYPQIKTSDYCNYTYIITNSNKKQFENLIGSTEFCNIIYGPKYSGKTHISHIWKNNNNAIFLHKPNQHFLIHNNCVIDNFDNFIESYEKELLHCFNNAKEHKTKLLLTTSTPLASVKFTLQDLSSRLLASNCIKLNELNDEILKVIIAKEFYIRQIKIQKDVIEYIINRNERSYNAIIKTINAIDNLSLSKKQNVNVKCISKILK